jgi:ribosomal protein S18 acetylase RimI-like enzyme
MCEKIKIDSSTINIAKTVGELQKVKKLDDIAFGQHKGISLEELIIIKDNGRVMFLNDDHGKMIAETQVLLNSVEEFFKINPNEAYCYGTAINPEHQGKGFAEIMFKSQEFVARETNKDKLFLTVRLENAKSIRSRLNFGFVITGYSPNYYGSVENDGARLIMTKKLNTNNVLSKGPTKEYNLNSCEQVLVKCGETVDIKAHKKIQELMETGKYEGINILKPEEHKLGHSKSIILLQHIDK